jgi:hypothetical protein
VMPATITNTCAALPCCAMLCCALGDLEKMGMGLNNQMLTTMC